MKDERFPSSEVREAASVTLGLVAYVEAGTEGIIAAAAPGPGRETSPLRVLAQTQRIQMALVEIKEALRELIPGPMHPIGLDDA